MQSKHEEQGSALLFSIVLVAAVGVAIVLLNRHNETVQSRLASASTADRVATLQQDALNMFAKLLHPESLSLVANALVCADQKHYKGDDFFEEEWFEKFRPVAQKMSSEGRLYPLAYHSSVKPSPMWTLRNTNGVSSVRLLLKKIPTKPNRSQFVDIFGTGKITGAASLPVESWQTCITGGNNGTPEPQPSGVPPPSSQAEISACNSAIQKQVKNYHQIEIKVDSASCSLLSPKELKVTLRIMDMPEVPALNAAVDVSRYSGNSECRIVGPEELTSEQALAGVDYKIMTKGPSAGAYEVRLNEAKGVPELVKASAGYHAQMAGTGWRVATVLKGYKIDFSKPLPGTDGNFILAQSRDMPLNKEFYSWCFLRVWQADDTGVPPKCTITTSQEGNCIRTTFRPEGHVRYEAPPGLTCGVAANTAYTFEGTVQGLTDSASCTSTFTTGEISSAKDVTPAQGPDQPVPDPGEPKLISSEIARSFQKDVNGVETQYATVRERWSDGTIRRCMQPLEPSETPKSCADFPSGGPR